jgi:hypothetical protein
MSYVTLANKRHQNNIFFISGLTDIGIDCYYYVQVEPTKIRKFEAINPGDPVNLDEFGSVLQKGYGEPTEAVKEKMKKEYNFE